MLKSLTTIPAIIWFLLSAIFFAAGEYLSKTWGNKPGVGLAFIVVAVYAMETLAWLPALLHKNQIAIMGTAWLVMALIATVSVGVFVFHEKITIFQWLGMVLALAALILIGSLEK